MLDLLKEIIRAKRKLTPSLPNTRPSLHKDFVHEDGVTLIGGT